MIDERYRYYAFISYKREDEQWAKWLHSKLEHYRLPTNLNGRTDLPRNIQPVFMDTSELTPGNLPEQIREALDLSKYLIVVCSPRSAQSVWVNKEVETFMSMGKSGNIIPLIIEGAPFAANPDEECYPKAILSLPQEREILGANVNEMGRDAAAVKVVARMFDVRFDEIWQRHEREKRRKKRVIMASLVALLLLISGVAFWMYLQRQATLKANWAMMENQARMVAEKAKEETQKGNVSDAILALLEMMPEDGSRPFVPELEEALRIAYDSLQSSKWSYRYMGRCIDDIYFSSDDKYIISEDFFHVDIYDTKSLCLASQIMIPDSEPRKYTFLSADNDSLLSIDYDSVDCYDVATGEFLKREPLSNQMKLQWMSTGEYGTHLSYLDNYWPWINEWKSSIGLSQQFNIVNFCPSTNLVIYTQEEDGDISQSDFSVSIYDYKQGKDIMTIENGYEGYNCYSSFSPDGKQVALDDNIVIDILDKSKRVFSGGAASDKEGEYTLRFGHNNQLLYYSPNADYIKIFESKTLTLMDSVKANNCVFCDINSDGNLLLVQNESDWCIYRKHNEFRIWDENEISFAKLEEAGFGDITFDETQINGNISVSVDYEGAHITDKSGEHANWHLIEENYYVFFEASFQNNRFVIVTLESRYDSSRMTAIMDFTSGTIVKQLEDTSEGDTYYYNEKTETLAKLKDDAVVEMVYFPSFEHLVQQCRRATDGMHLGKTARQKFHLE